MLLILLTKYTSVFHVYCFDLIPSRFVGVEATRENFSLLLKTNG